MTVIRTIPAEDLLATFAYDGPETLQLLTVEDFQLSITSTHFESYMPPLSIVPLLDYPLPDYLFSPASSATPAPASPNSLMASPMSQGTEDLASSPPPASLGPARLKRTAKVKRPAKRSPTPSQHQQHINQARCPKCHLSFTGKRYRSDLINHCLDSCYKETLIVVKTALTVKCPIPECSRHISYGNWKSNMCDHLETHDPERQSIFRCAFEGCNKVYMRKNSAIDCQRKHEGYKFKCEKCGKSFSDRYMREKHRIAGSKGQECVGQ